MTDDEVDEIVGLMADPRRLQEVLEAGVDDLRVGAQKVVERREALDLEYIDELDFTDDPVLARIRKNLRIS